MPLFGRKKAKASQVRMGNMGGMVPLVQTPRGTQPLQPILDALWLEIAATAWAGYTHYGRGVVGFDPETGGLQFTPDWDIAQIPDSERLLARCQ